MCIRDSLYVIHTPDRERLAAHLQAAGIGTLIHYPIPPHKQQAYHDLGCNAAQFPITAQLADTCLSLPLHPGLTAAAVQRVCASIRAFYG